SVNKRPLATALDADAHSRSILDTTEVVSGERHRINPRHRYSVPAIMVSQLHWLHEATPEKQHLLCLLSLMLAHQSRVAPTYRAAAYTGDITKKMALRHGPPMHKRQPVQNKGYALRLQPT